MVDPPKCKICGKAHWFAAGHDFSDMKTAPSPKPQPVVEAKPKPEPFVKPLPPTSKAKGKKGRPKGDQPWVALGITRQAWHLRQKKSGSAS
jgi:hypothetical protein